MPARVRRTPSARRSACLWRRPLALGPRWPSSAAARAAATRRARLDVLLIHRRHAARGPLGAYGHAGAATPGSTAWPPQACASTRAHAHRAVTLPSHANIFTGRYPSEHGVRDNVVLPLAAEQPTLATRLQARGYRTGAFVGAFPLDSPLRPRRGFDDVRRDVRRRRAAAASGCRAPAATRWPTRPSPGSRKGAGRPFFAWVHVYDPHAPYTPPAPFAAQFRGRPVRRRGRVRRRAARRVLGRRSTPAARTHARGGDGRPRRVAGRARRADARHPRLRVRRCACR